jgi:hypothetical protein
LRQYRSFACFFVQSLQAGARPSRLAACRWNAPRGFNSAHRLHFFIAVFSGRTLNCKRSAPALAAAACFLGDVDALPRGRAATLVHRAIVDRQARAQQRWIEITPYSPRCELGKSKTRLETVPD